MTDVTRILEQIEAGNLSASDELLPLVYDELRKLAAVKLAVEKPGQTLQPTALVHDAYIRLVDSEKTRDWDSRGHFFAAAAEAMRRILVERARRRSRTKHGGDLLRVEFEVDISTGDGRPDNILALDEALAELERHEPQAASLVKLRYFAGLTHTQSAESLGISRGVADRLWALARAWLFQQLSEE